MGSIFVCWKYFFYPLSVTKTVFAEGSGCSDFFVDYRLSISRPNFLVNNMSAISSFSIIESNFKFLYIVSGIWKLLWAARPLVVDSIDFFE